MNFTGTAGAGGDAWITVYDATPAIPDEGPALRKRRVSPPTS